MHQSLSYKVCPENHLKGKILLEIWKFTNSILAITLISSHQRCLDLFIQKHLCITITLMYCINGYLIYYYFTSLSHRNIDAKLIFI